MTFENLKAEGTAAGAPSITDPELLKALRSQILKFAHLQLGTNSPPRMPCRKH